MVEKSERKRYQTEVRPKIKATKNQMSLLKMSFNVSAIILTLNFVNNNKYENRNLLFLSIFYFFFKKRTWCESFWKCSRIITTKALDSLALDSISTNITTRLEDRRREENNKTK